ncbi:GNAT family N-acetyltransferase [Streptomyces pactum]|uniref:GNAT family N-acetyltransferase n=1 Tax=Streptomyces pactum TaxID=68249 RepID=UPI0036FF2167
MTHRTSAPSSRRPHRRRDLVGFAALLTAVAAAGAFAGALSPGPDGLVPAFAAAALPAAAGFHLGRARRRGHAPPPPPAADTGATAGPAPEGTTLWRMRTTVRDTPGSLAALCGSLARQRVDILTLQTHPLGGSTVDEFLLRVPATLPPDGLTRAVTEGGGVDPWLERADTHDLVDTPTRVLRLATRTALDAAELPLALRQLLGRCTIRTLPAARGGRPPGAVAVEGALEDTVLRLRDPAGGTIVVERPQLPFTPSEFARARALVELDARLGPRPSGRAETPVAAGGGEITVHRAGPADLAAAREMHRRCSDRTLTLRYHGPVADTDRYLNHLLDPRHGRTLAAYTPSGRMVALGHLLWDGDESEVALLVEDAWQCRGIGSELLRRLVALADEAGCEDVYAVTRSGNTGMVAAMRGLGLPLDHQIEEGTMVITARLAPAPEPAATDPLPAPHAGP